MPEDKNYDRTVCPLLTLQLFNYITSYDKLILKISFLFLYYISSTANNVIWTFNHDME